MVADAYVTVGMVALCNELVNISSCFAEVHIGTSDLPTLQRICMTMHAARQMTHVNQWFQTYLVVHILQI